jgi:carnitine O-palmitoyltransferase 2
VHVLDAGGRPLPLPQIHSQMMGIAAAAASPASSNPGVLTTAARDDWTASRARLAADASNAVSLRAVDEALFVVVLDDAQPATRAAEARTMLFGDGRSRWFDKSFSLIVTRSGKVAVNFEHSWGDGVCVLRMCNDVHATVSKNSASALADLAGVQAQSVSPLAFNTQAVAADMAAAAKRFDEHAGACCDCDDADAKDNGVDCRGAGSMKNIVVECKGLSRQQVKEFKVSPDGVMQMAIQLAYTRLHKQTVSVYESASTSSFLRGRTETIRSCTPASAAFVATMNKQGASAADKNASLRAACAVHGDVTFAALTGKGIDRHLFALKQLAARQPGPLPAFFSLPAYSRMVHNTLSTSTLSSPALDGGGFGPVVADGYGVGYGIQDEGSGFSVTSYMDSLPAFGGALQEAVADMQAVLQETAKKVNV